jgi:hypothetical protein
MNPAAFLTLPRGAALLPVLLAFLGCRLGDLVSTPAASPDVPAGLAQARSDGTTAIAPGGTTNEPTVTITASVSDPDARDLVTLEIEVRPAGVVFSDSATAAGTAVASGAGASIAVSELAENTAYHWQARAVDQTGRTSAWVPFNAGASGNADFHVDAVAEAPGQPASLAQLKSDGATAIAAGTATDETTIVFQATLSDADAGDSARLQVERQPVGTPQFTGTPDATSTAVVSGGTARVTLSGHLENVSYHWRARAIDRSGLTGPWVSFGGNPETQADYRIDVPEPPAAPTGLGQFRQNGNTPIAVGDSTDQTTVVFKATIADPDLGDQLRLEVELRPVAVSFTDTPTANGVLVASGATPQISVSALATGNYHWQVRAVDQTGRASPWVTFGTNLESETDFRVR